MTYVSGPAGSTYRAHGIGIDLTVHEGWLMDSGARGREGSVFGIPKPELGAELRLGATTEGWILGYIPAGHDFVLNISEHPAQPRAAAATEGHVYFAT